MPRKPRCTPIGERWQYTQVFSSFLENSGFASASIAAGPAIAAATARIRLTFLIRTSAPPVVDPEHAKKQAQKGCGNHIDADSRKIVRVRGKSQFDSKR